MKENQGHVIKNMAATGTSKKTKKKPGPRACMTGITDQYNVRGGKEELYDSPVTPLML